MSRQILHVPQRVRLAGEERHEDLTLPRGVGTVAGREQGWAGSEEADEEFLVRADLAVDVGAETAGVGEVEDDFRVGGVVVVEEGAVAGKGEGGDGVVDRD